MSHVLQATMVGVLQKSIIQKLVNIFFQHRESRKLTRIPTYHIRFTALLVKMSIAYEEKEDGVCLVNNSSVVSCSSCRRHARLVNLHSSYPMVNKPSLR